MRYTKFVFYVSKDDYPGLWLADTCGPAEQILTKLDRKQVINILDQVCVVQAYQSTKMAVIASDVQRLKKNFSLQPISEQNLTKFDRKLLNFITKFYFSGRSFDKDD